MVPRHPLLDGDIVAHVLLRHHSVDDKSTECVRRLTQVGVSSLMDSITG